PFIAPFTGAMSLRQPFNLTLASAINADVRAHIRGVSPEVRTTNQVLLAQIAASGSSGLFAGQASDCADLLMLAAEQVQSSSPRLIADAISDISSVGSTCATFIACRDLIRAGRGIDFSGSDGLLAIGRDGDVVSARYEQFAFDATGRDVTTQVLIVPSVSFALGDFSDLPGQ
ncbi:MAG TPA: hypothetical protein PLV68_18845, partial [Ilumatobacteraceae bacterium]|nr:hypothetical protein [Ilumatobacteraceae bacterium]